jgi:enoyl-CoA hydratase
MNDTDEILFAYESEHVAVITLNRPRVRNAVNGALARKLDEAVRRVEQESAIRVAILASSNDRVFCAGADLSEIAAGRADMLSTQGGGFAGFVDQARSKPWIAAVQGAALAGGFELCLACDMIVASNDAQFGLPEVKRGLIAAAGGLLRLPRALPRHIALELIATGEQLNATRAHALGLVNNVVPSQEVVQTAVRLAASIAANAPIAVRESLAIAREVAGTAETSLRGLMSRARELVFSSNDAREGANAFLEKRKPAWTGT